MHITCQLPAIRSTLKTPGKHARYLLLKVTPCTGAQPLDKVTVNKEDRSVITNLYPKKQLVSKYLKNKNKTLKHPHIFSKDEVTEAYQGSFFHKKMQQ